MLWTKYKTEINKYISLIIISFNKNLVEQHTIKINIIRHYVLLNFTALRLYN